MNSIFKNSQYGVLGITTKPTLADVLLEEPITTGKQYYIQNSPRYVIVQSADYTPGSDVLGRGEVIFANGRYGLINEFGGGFVSGKLGTFDKTLPLMSEGFSNGLTYHHSEYVTLSDGNYMLMPNTHAFQSSTAGFRKYDKSYNLLWETTYNDVTAGVGATSPTLSWSLWWLIDEGDGYYRFLIQLNGVQAGIGNEAFDTLLVSLNASDGSVASSAVLKTSAATSQLKAAQTVHAGAPHQAPWISLTDNTIGLSFNNPIEAVSDDRIVFIEYDMGTGLPVNRVLWPELNSTYHYLQCVKSNYRHISPDKSVAILFDPTGSTVNARFEIFYQDGSFCSLIPTSQFTGFASWLSGLRTPGDASTWYRVNGVVGLARYGASSTGPNGYQHSSYNVNEQFRVIEDYIKAHYGEIQP